MNKHNTVENDFFGFTGGQICKVLSNIIHQRVIEKKQTKKTVYNKHQIEDYQAVTCV